MFKKIVKFMVKRRSGVSKMLGVLLLLGNPAVNAEYKQVKPVVDTATCVVIVVVFEGQTYYYYDPTNPACA